MSTIEDALRTFRSIFARASSPATNQLPNPQFFFWSEQTLAKGASLASDVVVNLGPGADESTIEFALTSFRAWASHSEVKRGDTAPVIASAPASPGPRASLWKAYYILLSTILQQGVAYIPPVEGSKRVHLSTEFRRVESVCESTLLKNTKFPKANSSGKVVEEWVEEVIRNWEVLCGPKWCDDDLGEGGQDAVSRNVLDVSAEFPFLKLYDN